MFLVQIDKLYHMHSNFINRGHNVSYGTYGPCFIALQYHTYHTCHTACPILPNFALLPSSHVEELMLKFDNKRNKQKMNTLKELEYVSNN